MAFLAKNCQLSARMGSVRHNALNITDQHGGLLATTEPMSSTGLRLERHLYMGGEGVC